MARGSVYRSVGSLRPQRSVFNNSHSVLYDCDMGKLIPVCFMECVPGDIHSISMEAVIRFQPLVAPVLHDIYFRTFYFLIPTRLIMNEETKIKYGDNGTWEDFITGGQDGNDSTVLPTIALGIGNLTANKVCSLYDYFGLPMGLSQFTEGMRPLSFYNRCYNLVYNEYFRDQNLEDEVPLDGSDPKVHEIKNVMWRHDRFTSAMYDTQRGDRPAIPLQGLAGISFNGFTGNNPEGYLLGLHNANPGDISSITVGGFGVTGNRVKMDGSVPPNFSFGDYNPAAALRSWLNNNSLNMSQAVTFDTVDMRRLFQLQKYLERNMRVGARYAEQIPARFGVQPQDHRLQRPEYIGGSRTPIIISEVLQTSESSNSSKQGNLAGHGISADRTRIGKVRCYEHGYLLGLAVVQPDSVYMQTMHRDFLRRTRYDFLTPELVNLSEVALLNGEVCYTGTSRDKDPFGFVGIYDEYRSRENKVVGNMRGDLDYWHLARKDYNTTNPPSLNYNFVSCNPDKRIFAVQQSKGVIVHYGNIIRSVRPLPIIAEPGLIDHH